MHKRSRQSERLKGREPRHSHDADSDTEDRRRELPTGLPNGARVTEHCLMHGQTGCQATHKFLLARDPGIGDRHGLLLGGGPREKLPADDLAVDNSRAVFIFNEPA
jgi:hypothetical protein